MNRFVALALASLVLPCSAHAAGLLPMQSVRAQAHAIAKDANYLATGSGQSFRFQETRPASRGKAGAGRIEVWARGGSARVSLRPARVEIASAEVKIQQGIDGELVSTVKRNGQVWHTFSSLAR